MRVRDEVLGSWEGPLGIGETGRVLVTGWGVLGTGREGRKMGKGAPGLANVGSAGTGGDEVICCSTIRAETSVRPATAFLDGKGAVATAGAVQIHGNMTILESYPKV